MKIVPEGSKAYVDGKEVQLTFTKGDHSIQLGDRLVISHTNGMNEGPLFVVTKVDKNQLTMRNTSKWDVFKWALRHPIKYLKFKLRINR